jgi:transposase
MIPPIFVRELSQEERNRLEAGLRSSDAFVLRRCQILLASARGQWPPQIARNLGCDPQTVRNAIHAFDKEGLSCLQRRSSRPHTTHAAFQGDSLKRLGQMLHSSPRAFGKPTSLWTLELAAEVAFEEGLARERVSGETIRATLARLGVGWQRAKKWLTSPDPQYRRKRGPAIG